jgi:hypothetical protein
MNKTLTQVTVNPLAGRVNSDAHTMLYSGRRFYYASVHEKDFLMLDIAHHLARMGRWLGAMNCEHYSVAEHSWLLADYVHENEGGLVSHDPHGRAELALAALLHDSEEYVTGDFPSPLKILVPELAVYGDYLRTRIFEKFDIRYNMYLAVKPFDYRIRKSEAVYVRNAHNLFPAIEPLPVELRFWPPEIAEQKFLDMYDKLIGELGR